MPPSRAETAIEAFVDMLQTAQNDRLLPLVQSAMADFPMLRDYIYMPPDRMIKMVSFFWPKVKKKIEGQEDALIAKLYEVQGRLRKLE